jgi:hypothetical protein
MHPVFPATQFDLDETFGKPPAPKLRATARRNQTLFGEAIRNENSGSSRSAGSRHAGWPGPDFPRALNILHLVAADFFRPSARHSNSH